ncbi:hypothetical protein [Pseudactinotalea sp. Z1732]|uniref:hypothetical protein n=1 Tax=Micrococcales TaxID=85006 RepID=UPI003C79CA55
MNPTRTRRTGLRTGPVALVALAVGLALAGCSDEEPHEGPRTPEVSVAGAAPEETEPEPDAEAASEPEPDLPRVEVGETVQTVEGGPGEWEGTLVVAERGVVILESVAGTRNSRTELTLTGPDGQVYADKVGSRDPGEARFSDASQIDPLVIRTLDAGEYRVHVRGFDERASTDFEDGAQLRSWVPDRVEIGSTTEIDFAEGFGGGWHGAVTIPEGGEYTFTASRTDEHSQPVLLVVQAWEGSEPDQDLPDLYDVHVDGVAQLQHELPAGEYVVMVAEGLETSGAATIEIAGP